MREYLGVASDDGDNLRFFELFFNFLFTFIFDMFLSGGEVLYAIISLFNLT